MAEVISAYEQVTRAKLEGLEHRFGEHERAQYDQLDEIKQEIKETRRSIEEVKERLANRLPPWGTFVFSFVTFLIGTLITFFIAR